MSSSNDSSGVKEDGRKPDPGASDDDEEEEMDEEQRAINAEMNRTTTPPSTKWIDLVLDRKRKDAEKGELEEAPVGSSIPCVCKHEITNEGLGNVLRNHEKKKWWRCILHKVSENDWHVFNETMTEKIDTVVWETGDRFDPECLAEYWESSIVNPTESDIESALEDGVKYSEMVREEDNTSMHMVADNNDGEEDNTSMNEDDDDTTLPQIEPIKKASADVVNMAVKGTARWDLAYEVAIKQCGWEKEELDECLQFISDWAAKIVDGEDSIEYKQFQSYDYEESEGQKWTYGTNKKRVLGDVNHLIQARKLGGVSVHSVCLEDPTKITITRLPAINDTNIDYLRSKILFELYGVKDVIAHIHDGLVNYHQYAYNALTRNAFPFGYNAATSASNIIYSHGKLTVRPKKIFKAAYPNAGFDDGSIDNLFRGHNCRETIPSKKDIEERIGPQRWLATVNECAVQNMTHCIECLEKNVGKHGVLPGLLLPAEALIANEHLFKLLDRLFQKWQHKVEDGDNNVNQDDREDENENEFEFIDTYEQAKELLRDEDDGNLDEVVKELKKYLENRPDGIMAMIAGKLEGALKEKEPRANAYVSMGIIRAIEFHLRKDDRYDLYKSDGLEVTVTSKESMEDAGVKPLDGTCQHQAKMVCAPTIAERFFIQPGSPMHPISGMTVVVYMDENLKKLDNNSTQVHQIRVDESVFEKEAEKPKYNPDPVDTAALEAVLESATGYEDAKNGEAMANALARGFSIAFIKAMFEKKQEDHNI